MLSLAKFINVVIGVAIVAVDSDAVASTTVIVTPTAAARPTKPLFSIVATMSVLPPNQRNNHHPRQKLVVLPLSGWRWINHLPWTACKGTTVSHLSRQSTSPTMAATTELCSLFACPIPNILAYPNVHKKQFLIFFFMLVKLLL